MRLLALALAATACGGQGRAPRAPDSTGARAAMHDDPSCPLLVPGTSVSVEDTDNGAALVFVTTGDPLAVRGRAAVLAEMHTKHDGPNGAMGMMFSAGSTATATEVEGGARVEFSARAASQVAPLQRELHMHAGHLAGGTCELGPTAR